MKGVALARRHSNPQPVAPRYPFFLRWIVGLAALTYALLNPLYRMGFLNDDAVYVLGARNIAHLGAFQSQVIRPDYPMPGLPFLLSPLVYCVEPRWGRLEWAVVAACVVAVYLFGRLSRQLFPERIALMSAALLAFNPLWVQFSGILIPGPFLAAAGLGALLLLERLHRPDATRSALLLGAVLGWASLLRPEAGVILVAFLVGMAFDSEARRQLGRVLLGIALWGCLYGIWWKLNQGERTEFGSDIHALIDFWVHQFPTAIQFFKEMNYTFFAQAITSHGLLNPDSFINPAETALGLGLLSVILLGIWRSWKERKLSRASVIATTLYCAFYFGSHLFWHIPQTRYVIPILPFLLLFFTLGLIEVGQLFKKSMGPPVLGLGTLLIVYLMTNAAALNAVSRGKDPMKGAPRESLNWFDVNAPRDAKVISNIAPSVELYGKRPSITGVESSSLDTLLSRLADRKIDYVVDRVALFVTPGVGNTEDPNVIWERMRRRMLHYPDQFQVIYENPVEQTRIFKIQSAPGYSDAYTVYRNAFSLYEQGKLVEAEKAIEDCLRILPDLGPCWTLRGAVAQRQNNLPLAEDYYVKASQARAFAPKPLLNLATLYRQRGEIKRSNEALERAISLGDANGDGDEMRQRAEQLRDLWARRQGFIFLNAP